MYDPRVSDTNFKEVVFLDINDPISEEEDSTTRVAKRKFEETSQPFRSIKLHKRVTEPLIFSREHAYQGGVLARNKFFEDIINKFGEEELREIGFELEKNNPEEMIVGVDLPDRIFEEIETVANQRSHRLGSQLFELYQILESKGCRTSVDGKKLLSFAHRLIDTVERRETIDASDVEISDKYLELARKTIEKSPIAFSEEHVRQLALTMQKAMDGVQEENSEESEDSEARETQEYHASRAMGHLLLSAQHEIKKTANCITEDKDQTVDKLFDFTAEIVDINFQRLNQFAMAHQSTAIQSPDEAIFRKMGVEMAKLVLLDTGNINFAIIDDVFQCMVPDEYKELVAMKKVEHVLTALASEPMVWKKIANTKPPKSPELPSNEAIRQTLGLDHSEPITKRHAQLTLLSTVFTHYRQARAGTCFTTAALIKILNTQLLYFVSDLKEIIEEGQLTRTCFGERRVFPFQETTSKDYLDVLIDANEDGLIYSTKKYDVRVGEPTDIDGGPSGQSYLYEAPGIIAVCRTMGLADTEKAVLKALSRLGENFVVDDLIKMLAEIALEGKRLRSQGINTKNGLIQKGRYAFCSQTNHPLHRAIEQCCTEMVIYMGSQYIMPALQHMTLSEVLEKKDKGFPKIFQVRYKKLLKEMFLPMICRMRFRYNHFLPEDVKLFDDGNYGANEMYKFGYELWNTGLPKDFKYSQNLKKHYDQKSMMLKLERFEKYSPVKDWKKVEGPQGYVAFIHDLILETVKHLKSKDKTNSKLWDEVGKTMCQHIAEKGSQEKMITRFFGRGDHTQKRNLTRNPFTLMSKPWTLRWGGDFDAVLQTYYGFMNGPSKMKQFQGSQFEVLAKYINFMKKQPESIKEDFEVHPNPKILVTAPVHAFLLLPTEPSFLDAWKSEMNTNEYLKTNVIEPGEKIANQRLNQRQRKELIEYVSDNEWVLRPYEKHDFSRQQLTEFSKGDFDRRLKKVKGLSKLTVEQFAEKIWECVVKSRAADPRIGKRNRHWDDRFARVLKNWINHLTGPNQWEKKITKQLGEKIIDFARNRVDQIGFTQSSRKKFLGLMNQVSYGLSITEFRNALMKKAYKAHCWDLQGEDKKWKGKFGEFLDTKIFNILTDKDRETLIETGIVTHDGNWKEEIYDIHLIWMVNPGSGKLEMCNYYPDTGKVTFRGQAEWFPKTNELHGAWDFPNNYIAWPEGPLFNVKKLLDI